MTTVLDREPQVGHALDIDKRRWTVTDHSTYIDGRGLEVVEWECTRGDGRETAYLLREADPKIRWYFTRPIPLSALTRTDGTPFTADAAVMDPPDALTFRGRAYRFEGATEGTYVEEPGESVRKTTWDYWDAAREWNLAVERWPGGRMQAYHGQAIDPASIAVGPVVPTPAQRQQRRSMILVAAVAVFLVVTLVTRTVETGFTAVSSIGLLVAFGFSLRGVGPLVWGAPLVAILLGVLLTRFPPLTTREGLLGLVLAAAAVGWWATRRGVAVPSACRLAAIAVMTPAYVAGLIYYYRFAPTPRSIGQYVLAVAPAAIAMTLAAAIAWVTTRLDPTR